MNLAVKGTQVVLLIWQILQMSKLWQRLRVFFCFVFLTSFVLFAFLAMHLTLYNISNLDNVGLVKFMTQPHSYTTCRNVS